MMSYNKAFQLLFLTALSLFLFTSLSAQSNSKSAGTSIADPEFTDRTAIHTAIKNFFIGDHTGSIEHKKLSMHDKGAYRYVNRDGEYADGVFNLNSDDADPDYTEELIGIEIYDKMALAKCRLLHGDSSYYKLFTLHKMGGVWKITTITWGGLTN